jgi:hypothetical protein
MPQPILKIVSSDGSSHMPVVKPNSHQTKQPSNQTAIKPNSRQTKQPSNQTAIKSMQ